nr:hypothetical protein [Tanacetum cinerariifolium]
MEAIETRFGGNTKTKKVQKTLLKQQYENFTGSSSESMDQIHDRLQKLISQLEILGRNKTDLEEQSLDDLFNSLKIYEAEVKSSSSTSTSTQNIAFVSFSNTDSTNEPVSAAASVSAVSEKIHVSSLPNVDSLSNAVIYSFFASQSNSPQLENDDLKQIDADDLEEMDLKWNGAAEPQRRSVPVETSTSNALVSQSDGMGRNLGANRPTSMGCDISQVKCYNCHRKGHFMRNLPTMLLWLSLLQVLLLTMRYQSGNGYHAVPPPYTGTFMPPKPNLVFTNAPNDVETVHTAFNVELSPIKPDNALSHIHRPSAPIIEDWVSHSEDESKTKISHNGPSFVPSTNHVKPLRPSVQHVKTSISAANLKPASPKTKIQRESRNRKACFVCKSLTYLIKDCDYHEKKMAQTTAKNHAQRGNHKHYASMTLLNPQRHVVPTVVLTKSKLVPIFAARPVTTVVLKYHVTRPRQAKPTVTKPNSPSSRHINRSLSQKASNFSPKVTAVKVPQGNPQHALKNKGVIDSGCSRHTIGNMSYLSDFEEVNGRYVAFGGNPKGGKISGKDV